MTYAEKLASTIDKDTPEGNFLRWVYYHGRTEVARDLCNTHNAMMAQIRAAAAKSRYHRHVNRIVSEGQAALDGRLRVSVNADAIYHRDYDGDYDDLFCHDLFCSSSEPTPRMEEKS